MINSNDELYYVEKLEAQNKKLIEALENLLIEFNSWTRQYTGEYVERVRKEAEDAINEARGE